VTARRPDGRIVYVCGSTGSGKSEYVRRQLAGARRVLVWDIDDEYGHLPGFVRVADPADLVARLRRLTGPGRLAFVADDLRRFDWFSRVAFAWGQLAPCVAVAEEIADVTHPGKAPPGWGVLVRRGRKYGIVTYAVTQRPAEADKTALGNAAVIHVGWLADAADRATVARKLGVPVARLDALAPLDWLERDAAGRVTAGRLTFRTAAPAPGPKAPRRRPPPGSRASDPDRRAAAAASKPAPKPAPAAPAWTLDDL